MSRLATCCPQKKYWAKGLCKTCYSRQYQKANPPKPEDQRRRRLKCLYGLSMADYDGMVSEQNGRCYLCNKQPKKLFIDHCHSTKRVRRLLCHRCNFILGFFERTPELFDKYRDYLNE